MGPGLDTAGTYSIATSTLGGLAAPSPLPSEEALLEHGLGRIDNMKSEDGELERRPPILHVCSRGCGIHSRGQLLTRVAG